MHAFLDPIIFELMSSDKTTMIENYVIEEKLCSHPNGSTFYNAKHRILKKTFTLNQLPLLPTTQQARMPVEDLIDIVTAQVSLLRHLNGQGTPRCHKVIRTPHNLYIVCDQFPALNLKQYLLKNILTKGEKLEIMIKATHLLKSIHKEGVILNSITLQNVRVYDNGSLMVADLSLACKKSDAQKFRQEWIESYPLWDFPPELTTKGLCGPFTDVFMLGKLFSCILKQELERPALKYNNLSNIIQELTRQNHKDRITVDELLMELQTERNNTNISRKEAPNECFSALLAPPVLYNDLKPRKFSMDESNKERHVTIVPKITLKQPQKQNILPPQTLQTPLQKKVKSYSTATSTLKPPTILPPKLQFDFGFPQTEKALSQRSRSVRENNSKGCEVAKKINKKRNLAFLILSFSEFVVGEWVAPELGYLFVKYANLTLKDCLQELDCLSGLSEAEKELREMVIGEKSKIAASQTRMKQILAMESIDPLFRRELELSHIISDRYLQRKITQFCREVYYDVTNSKRPVSEATNILFQVSLMLKKVEMGSYENYWEKGYQSNNAFLQNQRCLQEKLLGLRYLKSQVERVLQLK